MNPAPTPGMVAAAAEIAGVCARPVISRVTDLETGETRLVPIACGHTREDHCRPCAERAKKLRMQQCREGWHLDTEPEWATEDDEESDPEGDDQGAEDEDPSRRVRSTRRRQDAPDLPRVPAEDRTIGRVFTAPDGKTYRPSMFVTLTLGSYGRVDAQGVPVDPARYDYRRAALDALHFPKLVDRFWQNLRRCAGYQVQYFATIEAQRRLAPHLHAAVRVGRSLGRCCARFGPPPITRSGGRRTKSRSTQIGSRTGPTAGTPIRRPASCSLPGRRHSMLSMPTRTHVVRFGEQDDIQGLTAGTPGAERAIGYLCKYLTKAIATTHDDSDHASSAAVAHIERLAKQVRWLPCAPTCANWLRYGIQPAAAQAGLVPGQCKHKAHDRANLGLGGRRVLVSRKWSGKTLAGHKADRVAVVRAALEEAGVDPDEHDEMAVVGTDGRWSWELLGRNRVDAATYAAAISQSIRTRQRWLREYEAAKTAVAGAARAGPAPPEAA
jgi:hypothetical protein